jgi:6-phosphogluconolactonase
MNTILSFQEKNELAGKASRYIVSVMEEALKTHGYCSIILAGGNTPRACYAGLTALIKERGIPLNSVYWFFGDERWVGSAHPQSNEGMARELLFAPLGIGSGQIISWNAGNGSPLACAARYARLLHTFFTVKKRLPDICLLGLGADGHTASLFPGSGVLTRHNTRVEMGKDLRTTTAAVILPDNRTYRLTLTPRFINKSKHIIFLIQGRDKAAAFARVRNGDQSMPAAWIKGKNLLYFIDDEALAEAPLP